MHHDIGDPGHVPPVILAQLIEEQMQPTAEIAFHKEVVNGAELLNQSIGYNPTRFVQMVAEFGGVGACKQLLASKQPAEGFTTLWEHGKLDLSFEAIILLPWFSPLFTDNELQTARQRLTDYGFNVETWLTKRTLEPPGWWSAASRTDDRE